MGTRGICALLLIAGLLVAGCGTTRTRPTVVSGTSGESVEKKLLEGALIIKHDGTYIHYKKKCESCGHVAKKISRFAAPAKGKAIISAFLCPKCGKAQRIVIKSLK